MKKIDLIGAGSHSLAIQNSSLEFGIEINQISDDNINLKNVSIKIIDDYIEATFIGIGDNLDRKKISKRVHCHEWATLIHPKAIIARNIKIGEGTVIMAGAIIQPGSQIGKHCIINSGAVIEHDCIIEDFVHVAPNSSLAGGVKVGEGSLIGIGSSIIPNIEIGSWTIIGAGSVVINDIPADSTAFGNPCRVKDHHEKK